MKQSNKEINNKRTYDNAVHIFIYVNTNLCIYLYMYTNILNDTKYIYNIYLLLYNIHIILVVYNIISIHIYIQYYKYRTLKFLYILYYVDIHIVNN